MLGCSDWWMRRCWAEVPHGSTDQVDAGGALGWCTGPTAPSRWQPHGTASTVKTDPILHTRDAEYVQMAGGLLCSGIALTLLDLAPATLFVAGRDDEMGYLPTGTFLDWWYAEPAGPGTRSAPAVLSLLDPDQDPACDARLLLGLPRIRGTGLEYQVAESVDGLPRTAGACVLFISPRRAPLTPHRSRVA